MSSLDPVRSIRSAALAPGLALALTLLVFGLVGCDQGETGTATEAPPVASERTVEDATIVVPYVVDLTSVNEVISAPTTLQVALQYFGLFQPLVDEGIGFVDGEPDFQPLLAESWETADDGLSITFTLREGLEWSDGAPLTAEDVRFTWQAQTSPEVGWVYAEVKQRIRDVEVVDERTARFHFRETYASQMLDATLGVILPRHAWGELPFAQWPESSDWFRENLVVSGPFHLESWEPQQRIVLRRNERYFDPQLPRAERIVFEIVPERAAQLAMLRSGAGHLVDFIKPSEASGLEDDPATRLETFQPRAYYFVVWNTQREPFDDPRVRRAMTLAIDRQEIVDSLLYGYGSVPSSPYPSNLWVHDPSLEPWPYDPDAARALLAEAGFDDTDGDGVLDRDGEPLRFEMVTNADNDLRRDIITLIQSQLGRLGVVVEPRSVEFNALIGPLQSQEFDAAVQALGLGTDLDLSANFHSRNIEGGLNWGAFDDPETDRLLDELLAATRAADMLDEYHALERRLHELQPLTLLYEPVRLVGIRSDLRDVDPTPISVFQNMRRWRLVEPVDEASPAASP